MDNEAAAKTRVTQHEEDRPSAGREYFELVAKSAGLLTLLAPAVGLIIRYIAFRLSGLEPADDLAAGVPVIGLAATGSTALLAPVIALVLFFIGARRAETRIHAGARLRSSVERLLDHMVTHHDHGAVGVALRLMRQRLDRFRPGWVSRSFARDLLELASSLDDESTKALARELDQHLHEADDAFKGKTARSPLLRAGSLLLLLAVAVSLAVTADWLSTLLGILSGTVAGAYSTRLMRRGERIGFSNAWPVLATIFLTAGVIASFNPQGTPPAYYRFEATTDLRDGWYSRLATGDVGLYLRACHTAPEPRVYEVPEGSVRSVEFITARPQPEVVTLWDLVKGDASVRPGIRYVCPDRAAPPAS